MAKPPEIEPGFLAGEWPIGSVEAGALPRARAAVTIVIPTNYRWTAEGGGFGPMPHLLHDLAVRLGREIPGTACDVFVLDDTSPPDRKAIAAAITAAFDGVPSAPPVYLVGVPEREALFYILDDRLPGDVDREILRFLVTHWGYGPQRVRGDSAAAGSPVLLSFDDDLRAKETITASDPYLEASGLAEVVDSFVYAPRPDFDDHTTFRVVQSDLIGPYLDVLGRTPGEIVRSRPGMPFSESTRNTKDAGLDQGMRDTTRPSQFVTTHDGTRLVPAPGDVVGVATGRKRSVPDVNAGKLLDYYVATGLVTGGQFRMRAIPSGPQRGFVTARDTNPDCAVMGRTMSRPEVARIPWLLSDPRVSARHGLVVGPYRAEDRLFTRPPGRGVLLAGVPAIFKHVRSEVGFRPDILASFWSELLGDTLGDMVLEILVEDPATGRFGIPAGSLPPLPAETAGRIRGMAMDKAAAIADRVRAVEADPAADPAARGKFLEGLGRMRADLERQCEPDREVPVLLEGHNGLLPRVFARLYGLRDLAQRLLLDLLPFLVRALELLK